MNPPVLQSIISEICTLASGEWTGGILMDQWLLARWSNLGRPPFQYIPYGYLDPLSSSSATDMEITLYRKTFSLPSLESGSCPREPKIGLLHGRSQQHYCCIVILPLEREIHVLGRRISKLHRIKNAMDWESWGGPTIWKKVVLLHGWEETAMTVHEFHWPQNGYDCGPIACQVMEHIWTAGFKQDVDQIWIKPALPCTDKFRIRMALDSQEHVKEFVSQLQTTDMRKDLGEDLAPLWRVLDGPLTELTEVMSSNIKSSAQCPQCLKEMARVRKKLQENPSLKGAKPITNMDTELLPMTDTCSAAVTALAESTKPAAEGEADDELSEEDGNLSQDDGPAAQQKESCRDKNQSQATLGRFPRPIPPVVLPPRETLRGLRLMFDKHFDDYEDGPTLEDLKEIPDVSNLADIDLIYIAGKIAAYPDEIKKDRGWRLQPSFFQTFELPAPILVGQHCMPAPILQRSGSNNGWNDTITVGPRQMIRMAKGEGTNMNIFLKGRAYGRFYLCVDMEKDAAHLSSNHIEMSLDIDSLIWITRTPQFQQAVTVFTTPVIRNHAPISKHNHMYVNLIVPQSEEDQTMGPRTEWWEKRFRLSQLPHVAFGKIGSGSGMANILLFLPRMAHQSSRSGRWVSQVPYQIQNQLWDHVINPAMKTISSSLDHPYVGLHRNHSNFKRGRQKDGSTTGYPFKEESFKELVKEIDRLVSTKLLLDWHQES
jgi:hypothetical protein